MPEIVAIGELLVEVMRKEADRALDQPADFVGPFPSGAPGIFADQAARLGHAVGMIGAVGQDGFGDCLVNRFVADGLDVSHIARVPHVATGVAFVMYRGDGSRQFIFHMANSAAGRLRRPDPKWLSSAAWLHICGSTLSAGETMRKACYAACCTVTDAGGKVSFDPNLRPELLGGAEAVREVCAPVLERASLVLPSAAEAEVLTGAADPDAACGQLLRGAPEVVVLKRGADGCRILSATGGAVDAPAYRVEAVDPTGAGDCFDAGFVVGLLEGLPLEAAGRLANACGALGATRLGPMEGALPRADVEALMAQAAPRPA